MFKMEIIDFYSNQNSINKAIIIATSGQIWLNNKNKPENHANIKAHLVSFDFVFIRYNPRPLINVEEGRTWK